ncbi:unnamed protein product [Symbiodinium pilosum]|uniref:Transmembrane protein n=1 Tax=Symbiodinium pilosum TaxID=2952 RepID=A0A812TVC7_SYMPI|nr:unnamed protein product [Symbiodinium pilosum]
MLRWLLCVGGFCCCLHLALGTANVEDGAQAEEDVCSSMQTRKAEPEKRSPRMDTMAINAEALDRLVENSGKTGQSAAFSEKEDESAVLLRRVEVFKDWIHSLSPEVQIVIKAVCISWALAASLGLLGLWCGVLTFHSPSKYISWKTLAAREESGGFLSIPLNMFLTLASVPTAIMHLDPETRRSMCGILFFFAIVFAIMWHGRLIQPVMKELASYLYVFALVGAVCVVILVDLWRRAHATFTGTFAGFRRMQQQFTSVQRRLGLQEEDDPHEEALYSAATVR